MGTPVAPSGERWFDKYITHQYRSPSGGSLTCLNFAAIKTIPEDDWVAVQAAEARELAARPAALAAAARSKYERVEVPRAPLNDGHSIPLVGLVGGALRHGQEWAERPATSVAAAAGTARAARRCAAAHAELSNCR